MSVVYTDQKKKGNNDKRALLLVYSFRRIVCLYMHYKLYDLLLSNNELADISKNIYVTKSLNMTILFRIFRFGNFLIALTVSLNYLLSLSNAEATTFIVLDYYCFSKL